MYFSLNWNVSESPTTIRNTLTITDELMCI